MKGGAKAAGNGGQTGRTAQRAGAAGALSLLFFPGLLIQGCEPKLEHAAAKASIEAAFTAANPPGRTGLELKGKAVWLEAPWFDKACLEQKDLAFNDDIGTRPNGSLARISPTYQSQRFITASTQKGYCVYLGEDPKITVAQGEWKKDAYFVPVTFSMAKSSPWFECLAPEEKTKTIEVTVSKEGAPVFDASVLNLHQGGCPSPLPAGEERGSRARPTEKAPGAPSRDEVLALAQKFDQALYDGDFQGALLLSVCYNLVDSPMVGACSVGELISVGPSFHGSPRAQDGTPWAEYVINKADDIGSISRDGQDASLYHVGVKAKGRDRSFAVQWVDGGWRMVGVIGKKAEALTPARYLYDLHKADRRRIFERRLAGDAIDEAGISTKEEEAGG